MARYTGPKLKLSRRVGAPIADTPKHTSKRQLVFRNHTLQQIATEFNRYNKLPKISVEGEALQTKRYSGVFDADDPESFLDFLALDHQLARRLAEAGVQLVPATEILKRRSEKAPG